MAQTKPLQVITVTFLLISILTLTACSKIADVKPLTAAAIECRNVVDGLNDLQQSLELPKHLLEYNSSKLTSDFDVNQYFQVLTHLNMKSGYVLDYVYDFHEEFSGAPLLYARKENAVPLKNIHELEVLFHEEEENPDEGREYESQYLRQIEVDGTVEGYVDLIVIQSMGESFYLFWHSNNTEKIICDQSDIDELLDESKTWPTPYSLDEINTLTSIDPSPEIIISKDRVKIRFVTEYSTSIYETTQIIAPANLLDILDYEFNIIIDHFNGIMM